MLYLTHKMDQLTVNFYNKNASELTNKYNSIESPYENLFPLLFQAGDKILDAGCGSGRDIVRLLELRCDAYGIEASDFLRKEAVKSHPALKERLFKGSLPNIVTPLPGPFDHLLLSAVIMHIPDNELFESIYALRKLLKEGSLAVVSHCPERDIPLEKNRDQDGRLFILRSSDQIRLLFEELGFHLKNLFSTRDKLNRSSITWETLVFEYSGESRSESIDRIESIINNDRKTATYKLALLRALCEIAQKEPHRAKWTSKGRVKVLLNAVSSKWIEYYLPLMGQTVFVPNKTGEKADSYNPIAFRKLLTELSSFYPSSPQGLAQFLDDRDRKRFTFEKSTLYNDTIKKINHTIIKGPITHTSKETFSYDSSDKTIIMEGALWREMVLLGHWIGDSLNWNVFGARNL